MIHMFAVYSYFFKNIYILIIKVIRQIYYLTWLANWQRALDPIILFNLDSLAESQMQMIRCI